MHYVTNRYTAKEFCGANVFLFNIAVSVYSKIYAELGEWEMNCLYVILKYLFEKISPWAILANEQNERRQDTNPVLLTCRGPHFTKDLVESTNVDKCDFGLWCRSQYTLRYTKDYTNWICIYKHTGIKRTLIRGMGFASRETLISILSR